MRTHNEQVLTHHVHGLGPVHLCECCVLARDDLDRLVALRAQQGAHLCRDVRVKFPSAAKPAQLWRPIEQDHVARCDVAVDEVLGVKMLDRLNDGFANRNPVVVRLATAGDLRDRARQRAVAALHRNVRAGPGLLDLEQLHDIRMGIALQHERSLDDLILCERTTSISGAQAHSQRLSLWRLRTCVELAHLHRGRQRVHVQRGPVLAIVERGTLPLAALKFVVGVIQNPDELRLLVQPPEPPQHLLRGRQEEEDKVREDERPLQFALGQPLAALGDTEPSSSEEEAGQGVCVP